MSISKCTASTALIPLRSLTPLISWLSYPYHSAEGVMPKKEKPMSPRFVLNYPPALKEAVSEFRFTNRVNSEAEAIRQLLVEALSARGIKVELKEGDKS